MSELGGGAGNPGGSGVRHNSGFGNQGQTGTGGLLIIYANTLENNGNISSNGSTGGNGTYACGGGSGGGSINLLYKKDIVRGYIQSNGGYGGTSTATNKERTVEVAMVVQVVLLAEVLQAEHL